MTRRPALALLALVGGLFGLTGCQTTSPTATRKTAVAAVARVEPLWPSVVVRFDRLPGTQTRTFHTNYGSHNITENGDALAMEEIERLLRPLATQLSSHVGRMDTLAGRTPATDGAHLLALQLDYSYRNAGRIGHTGTIFWKLYSPTGELLRASDVSLWREDLFATSNRSLRRLWQQCTALLIADLQKPPADEGAPPAAADEVAP